MRYTIAELVAILAMDASKFKQGIKVAETAASRMGKNLEKIGKRAMKMITLPILAIGTASVKMAMDFETQITSLYTIMDEATIQSKDWGQEVLDLSKKVGESTDVLAAGLYDLVGSGIDAAKAMGVLEIASKAAKAGQTDTATAVKALAAVLNSYSLDASKAEEVADTLFATVNFGIIRFEELAHGIGRVLPVAAAAGISLDELGAAITVMTLGGLSADMSMTALNAVILNFLKPAEQAVEAAAELGIDLSATALAGDGLYGTVMKISEALGLTDNEMEKLSDSTLTEAQIQTVLAEKLGTTTTKIATMFPNVRALIGFLSLAKKGGEEFTKQIENMGLKTGSTEAAFKKFATTTKFQFDLAMSSIKATGIEIGTKLLPIVNKLFKGVGELAGKFGKLSDAGQTAVITIGGIAATVPVLLYVTAKVMILTAQFKALGISITTAKLSALGLTGALIGLLIWTKTLRGSVDSTREAYEKYGHGLGITEDDIKDIIEAEEELKTSIEGVTTEMEKNIETILSWCNHSPQYLKILDELKILYDDDKISAIGYDKTLQYLISTQGMFTGSTEEVLEKAKYLGRDFDLVAMATDKVSQAVKDSITPLGQQTKAIETMDGVVEDATGSLDDLRSSFNKLVNTIFDNITTFTEFKLSQFEVIAAEKALQKIIDAGKEGTEEYYEAKQALDRANIQLITDSFKLNTSIKATTDQQKEARESAVRLGLQYVETGKIGISEFMQVAEQFGLSKDDIVREAKEMEIDVTKYFDEIESSGTINFQEIEDYFKATGRGITKTAQKFGSEIDQATEPREVKISVATSQAISNIRSLNEYLRSVKSKSVTVTVKQRLEKFMGMGGIIRGDKGAIIGMPRAAYGYVTPQTGREIPVIAHEGEVILNTSEQGNIAKWIMNKATTRPEGVGRVGDIKNIFNIAELIVREEADVENVAEVLFEKQEKFLRGAGNK